MRGMALQSEGKAGAMLRLSGPPGGHHTLSGAKICWARNRDHVLVSVGVIYVMVTKSKN